MAIGVLRSAIHMGKKWEKVAKKSAMDMGNFKKSLSNRRSLKGLLAVNTF